MTSSISAIQRCRQALDRTSADHPERPSRLVNLGTAYADTGASVGLETAIQLYHEALDETSVDHPDRPSRLDLLAGAYRERYHIKRQRADLDTAIRLWQEAFDGAPADYPERASLKFGLGLGYFDRASVAALADDEVSYDGDMESSLQGFREAIGETPIDHPERAFRLQCLGGWYLCKYRDTEAIANLKAFILHSQEAVDIISADAPIRGSISHDLASGYFLRYKAEGAIADRNSAFRWYQEALNHTPSHISDRLEAGKDLFDKHLQSENWPEAFQTASQIISLFPLLAPRALETSDKQRLLRDYSELPSDAAAVALNAGKKPFDAIQLLELGRGVIAGSLVEMRADISELQQKYPHLAKEYINFRDQLDTRKTSTRGEVDRRIVAGENLEKNIQEIRKLPGFDRFLLSPSEAELKIAAVYGPIVVINVSYYRCDALIVENSEVRSLELPRLTYRDILDSTVENLAAPQKLEWLWETVAQPVLNTLGLTQTPSDDCWPRIWWIPTNGLNIFPLHAAGYHANGSAETVLDRVMSSYSSSIKAIIYGRRQRHSIEGIPSAPARALLVAMEHAPGSSRLPFAAGEVEMLHKLCRSMSLEPIEPGRRKQDVMSHLPDCDIFHFAGHGYTDDDDPSKSYLLLEDGVSNALTVENLLELNIHARSPFLAYLSACGTGRIKDHESLGENIHLISACQLAGYRHVIGTLWEVNDQICVEMARMTYEGIRDRGMTDKSVCEGLHKATREARDRWLSMPVGAERGSRLARKDDASLGVNDVNTRRGNDGVQRNARLRRDVVSCDEDDKEAGLWVPYVHFGV